MIEIIYGGLLGILAALAFNRIAIFQIKRRTDESAKAEAVSTPAVIVAWVILSGLLFAAAFAIFKDTATRLEAVAYISVAISIGVVDLDIKKIPNSSVLALLIIRTVSIIYALATGVPFQKVLLPSLVGLAAGFILYQLPMFFGIPIGTGDVKYSAAIGYCLGAFGYLQAALIMAAGLIVYLIYLLATKKGSLKTAVPMGPYLSLGVIVTVLYPVFGELSDRVFFNNVLATIPYERVKNKNFLKEAKIMLRKWFKDEEGQGMVEYGLIIGLIAVVVIVALVALGPKIRDMFNEVNEELDAAAGGGGA